MTADWRRWARLGLFWLAAVAATTVLASLAHSWQVQSGLRAVGARIPFGLGLETALDDLAGMGPALAAVFAIALAIGFALALWLRPRLRLPALLAYPLAGALAVAAAMALMKLAMAITPIAGVRETLGLVLFCLAGATGGAIFARGAAR